MTIKDSKYIKTNSANHLYLIFNKVNGYLEEINGNKYLTLVPTNENKEKIKKYELWIKIIDTIRSITKNEHEIPSMVIVVKAFFHENNKHYPQVFLKESLYKLQIIYN